jgi:hypothetical protein
VQAPHIDRTDFLNPVVREKKRFENALDDSVAAGLNAGTQVLMNQVWSSSISHSRVIAHYNGINKGGAYHTDFDQTP